MKNKITTAFEIFKSLFKKREKTEESIKSDIKTKLTITLVLMFDSLFLALINFLTRSSNPDSKFMMWSTVALSILFGICALIVGVWKKWVVAEILIAIGIVAVFSFYGLGGYNQGFAILWIAIVPMVGMLFLSFRLGFIVSIYFLLFLIVILYILPYLPEPYKYVAGNGFYNEQFFIRFPALYVVSLIVSLFLSGQRIYYQNKAETNSLYDSLTQLKNRRYYNDLITSLEKSNKYSNITVISVDLNSLKVLNDMYGHDYGDLAIVETGNLLIKVFGKFTDNIFRTGGDEYVIFANNVDDKIDDLISQLKEDANRIMLKDIHLSVSAGYASRSTYNDMNLSTLISIADRNMYQDKDNYYRTNHIDRRRQLITNENDKEK